MTTRKFNESLVKYSEGSECSYTMSGPLLNPDYIWIRFKGPVALFPSLKNQKIKGTNILRPEAKARLVLATKMMNEASERFKLPHFETGKSVFMLILCAYRPQFDEDNFASTVKDWLEPRYIRGKDRGWGVGIVQNDRDINVYAVRKPKKSIDADTTDIYLVPENSISDIKKDFISQIRNVFSIDKL